MSTTFAQLLFPVITDQRQLADLLRLLCRSKALTPARYDECEPIRKVFDPGRIEDIAESLLSLKTFYWKAVGGIANGAITLQNGRGKETASLSVWTDIEKFKSPNDLQDLVQSVVARFGCTYGHLHYLSAAEVKRLAGSDTVLGNAYNPYLLSVNRWKLVRCIPNLYWANVFGPEYVALFGGRDRVMSAPAPVVKELAPDTFYIQLSENMLDFATRHAEVDAVREQVKRHLGADCFFDYEAGFERTYRVPKLGWEEPARPPLTAEALMNRLRR